MSNENIQELLLDIKKSYQENLHRSINNIKEEDLLLGWEISKLDIQGIPEPPDKYVYLIGAYYKEWFITECNSRHIYLVPKENFIGDFNKKCYNQQIKIYKKSDKVKEWIAGFSVLAEYCVDRTGNNVKKNTESYEKNVRIC